jgi:hypothetical protein
VATGALLHGPDDRPQASCSDVIATAVRELLAAGPDPLALVRYADAAGDEDRALRPTDFQHRLIGRV